MTFLQAIKYYLIIMQGMVTVVKMHPPKSKMKSGFQIFGGTVIILNSI